MSPYPPSSLIATGVILPLLGVVAVILRFYVRLYLKPSHIGPDDYMIVAAAVFVCGLGADQVVSAAIGTGGRNGSKDDPHRTAVSAKTGFAELIIEKLAYGTLKLSVLLFYRRIFFLNKSFKIINDILIALVTAWTIAFIFGEGFLCGLDPAGGYPCPPQEVFLLWFAITDVVSDILILTLPYPCIKALQMGRREKIGIASIFFLGTLSFAIGIVRLGFIIQTYIVEYHPTAGKVSNRDAPGFWTMAEPAVGVLGACIPPLGPLIRRAPSPSKMLASFRGHTLRSGSQGTDNEKSGKRSLFSKTPSEQPKSEPRFKKLGSTGSDDTENEGNGRAGDAFGVASDGPSLRHDHDLAV